MLSNVSYKAQKKWVYKGIPLITRQNSESDSKNYLAFLIADSNKTDNPIITSIHFQRHEGTSTSFYHVFLPSSTLHRQVSPRLLQLIYNPGVLPLRGFDVSRHSHPQTRYLLKPTV